MFYRVEIVKDIAKIPSPGIYIYSTEKEAMAAFHQALGGWMKKPDISSVLEKVIRFDGIEVASTYFENTEE